MFFLVKTDDSNNKNKTEIVIISNKVLSQELWLNRRFGYKLLESPIIDKNKRHQVITRHVK